MATNTSVGLSSIYVERGPTSLINDAVERWSHQIPFNRIIFTWENSIFKLSIERSVAAESNRLCDRISCVSFFPFHQFLFTILLSSAYRITFGIPKTIAQLMRTHIFVIKFLFSFLRFNLHMSMARVFGAKETRVEWLNADEQKCFVKRNGKNLDEFSSTFIFPTLENANGNEKKEEVKRGMGTSREF